VPGGDKTIHFAGYFVAALLMQASLSGIFSPRHLVGFCGLVILAAFDETTQDLVGRGPSMGDFLADAAGVVCGAGLAVGTLSVRKLLKRKSLP